MVNDARDLSFDWVLCHDVISQLVGIVRSELARSYRFGNQTQGAHYIAAPSVPLSPVPHITPQLITSLQTVDPISRIPLFAVVMRDNFVSNLISHFLAILKSLEPKPLILSL